MQAIGAIVVVSLIMQVLIVPQALAAFNNTQDLGGKASYLISTFTTANTRVSQTISNLNATASSIPQVSIEAFREAQTLANQSKYLYKEGHFSEALNLIIQAFQKLKQTLTTIYKTTNEPSTEQQIRAEQTAYLQNTIVRDFETLQRLENITKSASNRGINVTAISQKISTIKSYLYSGKNSLDEGNLIQTKVKVDQASYLINELTAHFNSFAATLKTERVASYIVTAEQSLVTLKQQLNSVSNQLSPSTQLASSAAITQAQTSLTKAKEYLNNQQITQTINELATVKTIEATITNYIIKASPTPTPYPNTQDTSTPNTSPSITSVKP